MPLIKIFFLNFGRFMISRALFDNLLTYHNEGSFASLQSVTHHDTYFFSVAARHLASFLENDERFCATFEEGCAIYPRDVACKT